MKQNVPSKNLVRLAKFLCYLDTRKRSSSELNDQIDAYIDEYGLEVGSWAQEEYGRQFWMLPFKKRVEMLNTEALGKYRPKLMEEMVKLEKRGECNG